MSGPQVSLRPQQEAPVEAMSHEEGEEEISGAQFLCETVIRSLTLEEAPDHKPPCRAQQSGRTPRGKGPIYRWLIVELKRHSLINLC